MNVSEKAQQCRLSVFESRMLTAVFGTGEVEAIGGRRELKN
jgi:hypothetical protein